MPRIYLAKKISAGKPASQAYQSRSISGFTKCELKDVPVVGKPWATELAYSGYKDNIEAFLLATATGRKVSTQAAHFPLGAYKPTHMPLPLPDILFALPSRIAEDKVPLLIAAFGRTEVKHVPSGSKPQRFIVHNPTWDDLGKIERLAAVGSTRAVQNTCQSEAIPCLRTLYACIELFLRTNTYFFRAADALDVTEDGGNNPQESFNDRGSSVVIAHGDGTYTLNENPKRLRADILTAHKTNPDQDTERSALVHKSQYLNARGLVLVAKPSPKPIEASWGAPNETPNDPGLLFPYFEEGLEVETVSLRSIVCKLFFRNFGKSTDSDARAGYQDFRDNCSFVASSNMGNVLGHLLKGIELALETQTHLWLLFEETYLGFVLFGEAFWIHDGGRWVEPDSADDLRKDILALSSHTSTLAAIVEVLGQCKQVASDDFLMVDVESVNTPSKLLDVLAITDEGDDALMKELRTLLQALRFKGSFRQMNAANVRWAIDMLTDNKGQDFGDQNMFIPLSDWAGNSTLRAYKVFASFGAKAFSFIDPRGTIIAVPKPGEYDFFEQTTGEPPQLTYDHILIYPCPVSEAVDKWTKVVEDGSVRMNFAERAQGSRAYRWGGVHKDMVWGRLKEAKAGGHIGTGRKGEAKKAVPAKRKGAPGASGEFDLDSILASFA